MNIPYWLLRLLPMWEYICPRCRKEVKRNSHECPHCGERYPLALKIPPTFLKDKKKLEAYVHEHIFPRVSKFERDYLTQYFTTFFSDGFESYGFTYWTSVTQGSGGNATVDNDEVYSGVFSAHFSTTTTNYSAAHANEKLSSAYTVLHARAYFFFSALPGLKSFFHLLTIQDSNSANIADFELRCDLNSALWWYINQRFSPYAANQTQTPTIATNTWYCIEFMVDMTTIASTRMTAWINGNQVMTDTFDATGKGNLQTVWFGNSLEISSGGTGVATSVYVDNCVIADSYVGPDQAISASDSGSGSDSAGLTTIGGESGSGADAATLTATAPTSDLGQGAETAGLQASVPTVESGQGTDVAGLQATIPGGDSGLGSDSSTVLATAPFSESGLGVDVAGLQATVLSFESGVGSEGVQLIVLANENGVGAEGANVEVTFQVPDSGVGSDGAKLRISVVDAGSGSEVARVLLSANDVGAGADSAKLQAVINALESAVGSDSALVQALIKALDSGSSVDQARAGQAFIRAIQLMTDGAPVTLKAEGSQVVLHGDGAPVKAQ